jgi:hypothetical protein
LLKADLAPAAAKTDGWSGYSAPGITDDPHVIGSMAALSPQGVGSSINVPNLEDERN